MNITKHNKFNYFSLGLDLINWLEKYPAPDNEMAFAKNIPNTTENHKRINEIAKIIPLRRRYRGHSKFNYRRPVDFVHKDFADTIALYEKG